MRGAARKTPAPRAAAARHRVTRAALPVPRERVSFVPQAAPAGMAMTGRVRTTGDCGYCGKEMTARGLTLHLRNCAARRKVIEQADRGGRSLQDIYQLRVQGRYRREYWLHLEMCGDATLEDLDYYLRTIWLECCGHLSQFKIGGMLYDHPGDFQEFESMDVSVDRLFGVGLALFHEYDFGSTTELAIKVLDRRQGPTDDGSSHRIDGPQYPPSSSLPGLRRTCAAPLPRLPLPRRRRIGGLRLRGRYRRARGPRRLRQHAGRQLASKRGLRLWRASQAALVTVEAA